MTARVTLCLALSAATALPARAAFVALTPSADTFITQHPFLGGPDSTHGADAELFAIRGFGGFESYPLVRFDLSGHAGQTVAGPATLTLRAYNVFAQGSPREVSVHEVLVGWDPATATFNTFGPAPGVDVGTDTGAALDTRPFVLAGGPDVEVTWTIPAAVVQGWIDAPATNNGLLLNNTVGFNLFDVTFRSAETGAPPVLRFETAAGEAVPEPASLALVGVGGLGLLGYARRRAGRSAIA